MNIQWSLVPQKLIMCVIFFFVMECCGLTVFMVVQKVGYFTPSKSSTTLTFCLHTPYHIRQAWIQQNHSCFIHFVLCNLDIRSELGEGLNVHVHYCALNLVFNGRIWTTPGLHRPLAWSDILLKINKTKLSYFQGFPFRNQVWLKRQFQVFERNLSQCCRFTVCPHSNSNDCEQWCFNRPTDEYPGNLLTVPFMTTEPAERPVGACSRLSTLISGYVVSVICLLRYLQ